MLAKEFVKRHEGLSLKAYPDPGSGGEPYTIGYGHTGGIGKNDTCTQEQAEAWLEADLAKCYNALQELVIPTLNENQKAALTSFIFNVGVSAFSKSTLLKLLNQSKFQEAADQLLRWNKASGKVLAGLTKRRKEERELFLTPVTEKQMAPFIAAAIPALISALPEFAKIFKKPDVSERNVEAVVKASEIVMEAVGATNIQEAVEKIQEDPKVAQTANESLRLNRADIMDIVERVEQMETKRVDSARSFNSGEKTLLGRWKYIHLLSTILVLFTGAFAWTKFESLDTNMQSMVMTAIIIGGFTAVIAYWLGSSSGSDKKTDDLINRIEK